MLNSFLKETQTFLLFPENEILIISIVNRIFCFPLRPPVIHPAVLRDTIETEKITKKVEKINQNVILLMSHLLLYDKTLIQNYYLLLSVHGRGGVGYRQIEIVIKTARNWWDQRVANHLYLLTHLLQRKSNIRSAQQKDIPILETEGNGTGTEGNSTGYDWYYESK